VLGEPVAPPIAARSEVADATLSQDAPGATQSWVVHARAAMQPSPTSVEAEDAADRIAVPLQPALFLASEIGPAATLATWPTPASDDGDGKVVPLVSAASDPAAPLQAGSDLGRTDAIVGVWSPDAGACSAKQFRDGSLPTVITADGAAAGETFCMFTNRKQTENGWTVIAKCSSSRERWTSNVRLTVGDNRLTWTSKRGTQTYTRCAPDLLMAQAR